MIRSIDFAVSSAFSKIFSTKSQDLIDIIVGCYLTANLSIRKKIFLCKYVSSNSIVCRLFVKMAGDEYAKLW